MASKHLQGFGYPMGWKWHFHGMEVAALRGMPQNWIGTPGPIAPSNEAKLHLWEMPG